MRNALSLILACGFLAAATQAEDRPWSNTADVSLVMTGGNSQTQNLTLTNKFTRKWTNTTLTVLGKVVSAEATSRVVSYDAVNDVILVTENTEKSAEAYELGTKLKGKLAGEFQWYTNVGWFQDKLSGVDQRITAGAGFGYTVFKNDTHSLASEAGFEFTDETPVEGDGESFGSARGFLDYVRPLSETSEFTAAAEILSNMSNSEDLRLNLDFGLASRLSDRLAMKLAYGIKYDGDPITESVAGTTQKFVYDKMDTVLSMSLVLNL